MSMRILMVGDDPRQLAVDTEVLKQRNFRVYTCTNHELINELIEEIKPEVVFVNPGQPTEASNTVYHQLMDNVRYARLPVVYTLSEDDVYLVNRKRTSFKENRNVMADSMIEALKIAMTPPAPVLEKASLPTHRHIHLPRYARGA